MKEQEMENSIVLGVIILGLVFLSFMIGKKSEKRAIGDGHYPYKLKPILTKTEYEFYKVLREECEERGILICPKVRMEDYLTVTDKENYMKYRGHVKSRHIDFILCNDDMEMLAGIELDDSSHERKDVKEVDNFKDAVFKKINIPLYRVKTSGGKYKKQINEFIESL